MYSKTYKTTLKTITRSPLTWAAVALLLGVALFCSFRENYGRVDMSTYELILDTDRRFRLDYHLYIQHIRNALYAGALMWFSAPAFCVIVTSVVLNRDRRDGFFEIERAGGVRPCQHFFGRFAAVLSFVTLASLIVGFTAFHVYCLTRGGAPEMSLWEYFRDSSIRLLRVFFLAVFPGILIFVSFTFMAGSVLRSGLLGAFSGLCLVVFKFMSTGILRNRLPVFYHDYLCPAPINLYLYWGYYDTEWFGVKEMNPFDDRQMIFCLCCLYLISAVSIAVSYFCVRKRKV